MHYELSWKSFACHINKFHGAVASGHLYLSEYVAAHVTVEIFNCS